MPNTLGISTTTGASTAGALARPRPRPDGALAMPGQMATSVHRRPRPEAEPAQPGQPAAPATAGQPHQPAAAPRPQMTFAQMQRAGMARPAPPPAAAGGAGGAVPYQTMMATAAPQSAPAAGGGQPSYTPQQVGAFTPATSPQQAGIASSVEEQLAALLANPSAGRAEAAQGAFDQFSRQIDDQYALDQQRLEEEMAARGLSDSSIYGGRMADLNVGKRSAETELADRLMQQLAANAAEDQRAAIAQGAGYGDQTFNQGLAGYNANLAGTALNNQSALAGTQFGQQQVNDRFSRGFQQQQADRSYGLAARQQDLSEDLGRGALGLNQRQQDFAEEIGRGDFGLQAGYYDLAREGQVYDRIAELLGLTSDPTIATTPDLPAIQTPEQVIQTQQRTEAEQRIADLRRQAAETGSGWARRIYEAEIANAERDLAAMREA